MSKWAEETVDGSLSDETQLINTIVSLNSNMGKTKGFDSIGASGLVGSERYSRAVEGKNQAIVHSSQEESSQSKRDKYRRNSYRFR